MLNGVDVEQIIAKLESLPGVAMELVRSVLSNDPSTLALRMHEAGESVGVHAIETLREKNSYVNQLESTLELAALEPFFAPDRAQAAALSGEEQAALRYVRRYLRDRVRGFVDATYALEVDATGRRAIEQAAMTSTLASLPPDYHAALDRVVERLARELARNHRRRLRRANRGRLDTRRVVRDSITTAGVPFALHFKRRRIERGTVFLVCDVSNSVRAVARVLLIFLHALADVLPNVRVFAFSNQLGEITDVLHAHAMPQAVEQAFFRWGAGTTDYGHCLVQLRGLIESDMNRRSSLIMLGDARSNYYPSRSSVFRGLAARARSTYWLNPEERHRWGEGDSDMHRYAAACHRVLTCNRLAHIERFADELLRISR